MEFRLPDLGEGIHEGEVLAVRVSLGDSVMEGDPILEVETDKAAVEITSPCTGRVTEIRVKPGDMVKVGDVLLVFNIDEKVGTAPVAPEPVSEKPKAASPQSRGREKPPVPASPATRRLARELGVDLGRVTPTGPGGLVTAEDVKGFSELPPPPEDVGPEEEPPAAPPRPISSGAPEFPDFSKWGPVDRLPMRSVRRATARQMTQAWSRIPHVSNQDWIDITELESFRQKRKAGVAEKGGHLTLTVFALKAAAAALKAYPHFNASLDADAGEIIVKQYYHLGVAVDTDDGLIVPVIRDVDRKSITELAIELKTLVGKTRERKIPLDELQGGTFTITNVGASGGGHFAPIINYPQMAIFGLGRARMQPVAVEKAPGRYETAFRLMLPVVLCFDHRVLDGRDATRFLRVVIDALEDPEELLMTMV